ncbi:MAG: hypothetical protein KF699_05355 [Phycisphaeraceae bacterium]|nr:hypothetical protein [Phycisphaeraceae bacterium]
MNPARPPHFALIAAAALACAAPARAEFIIASGFESPPEWVGHFIGTIGTLNIPLSGGNPGAFADLGTHLSDNTRSAAGLRHIMEFTLAGIGPISHVGLSADYRRISGVDAEFVPFLLQSGLVYTPLLHAVLGQSDAWTGTGVLVVPIDEFVHPTGTPLSSSLLTSAGFFVRLRSETPAVASARVGIDNINIHLVPAPVSIAPLLAAGVLAARRQRA